MLKTWSVFRFLCCCCYCFCICNLSTGFAFHTKCKMPTILIYKDVYLLLLLLTTSTIFIITKDSFILSHICVNSVYPQNKTHEKKEQTCSIFFFVIPELIKHRNIRRLTKRNTWSKQKFKQNWMETKVMRWMFAFVVVVLLCCCCCLFCCILH